MSNIIENTVSKYRVVVDGVPLYEAVEYTAATAYIANLLPDTRAKAQIITITESGQQVLLG